MSGEGRAFNKPRQCAAPGCTEWLPYPRGRDPLCTEHETQARAIYARRSPLRGAVPVIFAVTGTVKLREALDLTENELYLAVQGFELRHATCVGLRLGRMGTRAPGPYWRCLRYRVEALIETGHWDGAAAALAAVLQQYADEVHVSTNRIVSTAYEWHGGEMPEPVRLDELTPLRHVEPRPNVPVDVHPEHPDGCPCHILDTAGGSRPNPSLRPDWDAIQP